MKGGENMLSVNFLTILVATIVNMVLGFIWYGPLLGKQWMKASGRTKESMEKEKKDMPMVMGLMFVGALVMAYILALFIKYAGATTFEIGAKVGFLAWLGFVATTMLADVLYEKKNKQLAAINLGFNLVALIVAGAILAAWK